MPLPAETFSLIPKVAGEGDLYSVLWLSQELKAPLVTLVAAVRSPGTIYGPRMLDTYECPESFCLFSYHGCGQNCVVGENSERFHEWDDFMWNFSA